MVKEVTYFVHEEFNEETYESCKNVQYPEVSSVLHICWTGQDY